MEKKEHWKQDLRGHGDKRRTFIGDILERRKEADGK